MMNLSSIVGTFAGASLAAVYSLGSMGRTLGVMPVSKHPLTLPLPVHFIDPTHRNSSFIDGVSGTKLGEPLNVSVFFAMSTYHMSLKTSSRLGEKQ